MFPFYLLLLPPTYSFFQPPHSLMSGTDLKICHSFFLVSLLVEDEDATILCWSEKRAVGGCNSNWKDSMRQGGWWTGLALTLWYFLVRQGFE